MAISMRDLAVQELSLSQLMNGRTQLKTGDVAGKVLTIIAFDFATITQDGFEKEFPVIIFKEFPEQYYNGGTVLKKLCTAWASAYGDAEGASRQLGIEGGVQVRITETRTKSGNNLVSVSVL